MKARFLRTSTLEELRDQVPAHLDQYRAGNFNSLAVDETLWFEHTIEVNEEKLSEIKLPAGPDAYEVENCIVVHDAFQSLSPYEARDERLWVYYSHVNLLDYSRQRWPIPSDDDAAVAHIRRHFFARDKRQTERDHSVSRLWWMAHLCARVPIFDLKLALSAFLFKSDVRANLIERPTSSQSTALFGAVLWKLIESYEGDKELFNRRRFRDLMAEINSLGGYRLIDCFDANQANESISRIISEKLTT